MRGGRGDRRLDAVAAAAAGVVVGAVGGLRGWPVVACAGHGWPTVAGSGHCWPWLQPVVAVAVAVAGRGRSWPSVAGHDRWPVAGGGCVLGLSALLDLGHGGLGMVGSVRAACGRRLLWQGGGASLLLSDVVTGSVLLWWWDWGAAGACWGHHGGVSGFVVPLPVMALQWQGGAGCFHVQVRAVSMVFSRAKAFTDAFVGGKLVASSLWRRSP